MSNDLSALFFSSRILIYKVVFYVERPLHKRKERSTSLPQIIVSFMNLKKAQFDTN